MILLSKMSLTQQDSASAEYSSDLMLSSIEHTLSSNLSHIFRHLGLLKGSISASNLNMYMVCIDTLRGFKFCKRRDLCEWNGLKSLRILPSIASKKLLMSCLEI